MEIYYLLYFNLIYILKINNNNNIDIIDTIKNNNGINLAHVIELKNENLVSADEYSYEIKLWKKNNNNNYEQNIVIEENNRIEDVIEIKDNIIAYDVCNNNNIIFYDLNLNNKLKTFNNIEVNDGYICYKRFCLINDNILLYSNKNKIHFFDINEYKYIKNINVFDRDNSLFKLNDNYLLTGSREGNITQYKINNNDIEKISIKKGCHEYKTVNFAFLNNEFILSSGDDKTVKIWKINN